MSHYQEWAPYVPVARRRSNARKKMAKLRKKGLDIQPIEIDGRKITKTFWGQAWCDQMESLGDFENRLPRGRTYVRNGSVCHLAIKKGAITAMVSGSSLYNIEIKIDVLPKKKWATVKSRCAGQIGSLLELLQGRLSDKVMDVVTDLRGGLFPLSKEIHLGCSCPDWAIMCKHVAAVLYGVGARLDEQPELLFLLRGVKHDELICADAKEAVHRATRRGGRRPTLDQGDLSDVFGIELDTSAKHSGSKRNGNHSKSKSPEKKSTKKKRPTRKKKKNQPAVPATKKKASGKKSAKKKPATKKPKKKVARKTTTKPTKKAKPTKKKASRARAPKKKTGTRPVKKRSRSRGK